MAGKPRNPVLRYVRRMAAAAGTDPSQDQQLLERFVTQRDETAFEELLRRYSPLVWGVCRRILTNPHDAEDAFQATFLVLVRKAGSIGRRHLVGPWLYGVAHRIAVRARASAAKRRGRERQVEPRTATDSLDELAWRDLRPILDEEVRRLPEKYRLPFVLCHLEGKTNEEAARQLGCPTGTVLSRLARARERLRNRLTRRGVAFSLGGLALGLSPLAAPAAPGTLIQATIQAALPGAAGPAAVAALMRGELQAMLWSKLLTLSAVLAATGVVGAGAGALSFHAADQAAAGHAMTPAAEAGHKNLVKVPSQVDGVLVFLGAEIKEGDHLPLSQVITVQVGSQTKKYRRLKKGDRVESGQLLGLVNDQIARDDVVIKRARLKIAEAELQAALKIKEEALSRYKTQTILYGQGGKTADGKPVRATSEEDLRAALLLSETKHYEWVSKQEAVKLAEAELRQAEYILKTYEIRSPVDGVIKAFSKRQGEAVRRLETVLVIRLPDTRE